MLNYNSDFTNEEYHVQGCVYTYNNVGNVITFKSYVENNEFLDKYVEIKQQIKHVNIEYDNGKITDNDGILYAENLWKYSMWRCSMDLIDA